MTNEDDMIIREAARRICAGLDDKNCNYMSAAFYLSGERDNQSEVKLVEQGIRRGIEIGRST